MEERTLYLFLLILFEIFEASWQRSDTFYGIIENIIKRYKKGQTYFYLSHPAFWFVLYVSIKYNIINFWMVMIVLLKASDIAFKLWIIQNIQKGKSIEEILQIPKDLKISSFMIYINTLVYSFLFYKAIF